MRACQSARAAGQGTSRARMSVAMAPEGPGVERRAGAQGGDEAVEDVVQHRAAERGVGFAGERVEPLEAEHAAGIDGVGVADEAGDLGDRELPGPGRDGRLWRGPDRAGYRGRAVERLGMGEPAGAAGAHGRERVPPSIGQAVEQVRDAG